MRTTTEHIASPKHVGIWVRVSTEDQARGESPEHHEKRARFYAEAKGWKVAELYDLSGVSGKSVMEHPEAKRMLADVKSGRITGLIFSKLARLARNTRELLEFSDIFREHGADLISLHEAIDTTSPAGRLFYTMIAAMAQWEREEIAERCAASVPIRAKLGKPLGGKSSLGYRWRDGKLVIDQDEAPVRKLIYELFLEHRRKKTVARILNERGYRTRNGSLFTDTTVDRLIRDPTAKGFRRANYTKHGGTGKQWVLKPESDWVWHEVEPIVPEALWNECNAILDERRAGMKRPARKPVHLFAGIVRCACGARMYVFSESPKYVCKACRNKIPTADLEGIFHEQLKRFFFSQSELAAYLLEASKTIADREERLRGLEQERLKLTQEMDKLYQLYLDDRITKEGFGERYLPMETRRRQIDEQAPKAQAEIDLMRIHHLASDQVIADARDLYTRWPSLTAEDKRKIIEAITEEIVVGKDDIDINLCYLPPATPPSESSSGNGAMLATHSHGFIAATSCTRAG